jgi:hypothetical protein
MKSWFLNGLKDIAISLIDHSYSLCLVICMLAIILYIAGLKKAGKYASISLVIYILLQSCKGLLR